MVRKMGIGPGFDFRVVFYAKGTTLRFGRRGGTGPIYIFKLMLLCQLLARVKGGSQESS